MTEPDEYPNIPVTIARIEMKLDLALNKLDDHEERIRASEHWRWAIPLTLLVALATAGGSVAVVLGR